MAVLKHREIGFLEFQVVEKTEDKITLQNIYCGKTETLSYQEVSNDYYYIYDAKYPLFNK